MHKASTAVRAAMQLKRQNKGEPKKSHLKAEKPRSKTERFKKKP